MATPKFSTQYDHHDGPTLSEFEPSRTKQEFAAESDINVLLATYERTGQLPAYREIAPTYADVSNLPDYQEALNFVADANRHFSALPAKIRERFHNDPGQLLAFLGDENNQAEAIDLGLLKKIEPPAEPAPAPAPDKKTTP